MGIVRESSATATGSSSPVSFAKPAGLANGDILVASFAMNGGSITTPPADWVLVAAVIGQSNPHLFVYLKVIVNASTEPATYSWTTSGVAWGGGIIRYSGVDNSTPIDVSASQTDAASGTSISCPGIIVATDEAMVCAGAAINSSNINRLITYMSGPASIEVWDIAGKRNEYDDNIVASSGTTSYQTWSAPNGYAWACYMFALRPASTPTIVSENEEFLNFL
jgi:hypothetical protein